MRWRNWHKRWVCDVSGARWRQYRTKTE